MLTVRGFPQLPCLEGSGNGVQLGRSCLGAPFPGNRPATSSVLAEVGKPICCAAQAMPGERMSLPGLGTMSALTENALHYKVKAHGESSTSNYSSPRHPQEDCLQGQECTISLFSLQYKVLGNLK